MPESVSDSYDPEFGTGLNADDIRDAIQYQVLSRLKNSFILCPLNFFS